MDIQTIISGNRRVITEHDPETGEYTTRLYIGASPFLLEAHHPDATSAATWALEQVTGKEVPLA